MRLPDTLVYADIQQLSRIAKEYALPVNLHSKNELVQSLLYKLMNGEELTKRIDGLSPIERRFLLLLLAEETAGYSREELVHKANWVSKNAGTEEMILTRPDMEGNAPGGESTITKQRRKKKSGGKREAMEKEGTGEKTDLVEKMERYGWLFLQREKNMPRYRMPEDLKGRLKKLLVPAFQDGPYPSEVKKFSESRLIRREPLWLLDLMTFLAFTVEDGVRLTKEGVIHKTQLNRLLLRLSTKEEALAGKGWRFGYGRRFGDYPDLFSLLYDFAFYNELIEEGAEVLLLKERGRMVLSGDERIPPRGLFDFWLRLYRKPISNLPSILSVMKLFLHNGLEKKALYHQLEPFLSPFYYDGKEEIYHKRILAPLLWMEWLIEERRGEAHFLRLSPLWDVK